MLQSMIEQIKKQPDSVEFQQVMDEIASSYHYTPAAFSNGLGDDLVLNEAGTNEGSCKIFAFARLNRLSQSETLACFGRYYREDVLQHPENTDHANIRTFMRYGWEGVVFTAEVLRRI